jgi:hypothetical protein
MSRKESAQSGGGISIGPVVSAGPATKVASPKRTASGGGKGGGTIKPVYGERRPMTYHLFETEMRSISAFNGEALRYFSLGSFAFSCTLNIVIGYGFATGPLPAFGQFILHWGLPLTGALGALCFGLGVYALREKATLIKQIESETVAKS